MLFEFLKKKNKYQVKGSKNSKEDYFTVSNRQLVWTRFKKTRLAMIALYLLGGFILLSVFAPFFAPYPPVKEGFDREYLTGPPQIVKFWDEDGLSWPYVATYKKSYTKDLRVKFEPNYRQKRYIQFFVKGWAYCFIDISIGNYFFKAICNDYHLFGVDKGMVHLFGTGQQKKDLFSRTIFSIRVSLMVGAIGVFVSFVLALFIGGVSGYFGGKIDQVIQAITDSVRVIPTIPMFMTLSALAPDEWSMEIRFFFISGVLGLVGWPTLARRIRSHILSERVQDYVKAAELFGGSPLYIIFRHLLPSFTSYIIVDLMISFPYMVLSETTLSFIGLGLKEPVNSLGVLMQNVTNADVMLNYQWYFIPVPIFIILVLTFVFVGDGLRDAVDPYGKAKK